MIHSHMASPARLRRPGFVDREKMPRMAHVARTSPKTRSFLHKVFDFSFGFQANTMAGPATFQPLDQKPSAASEEWAWLSSNPRPGRAFPCGTAQPGEHDILRRLPDQRAWLWQHRSWNCARRHGRRNSRRHWRYACSTASPRRYLE